jgi:hypothetical protein
MMAAVAPQVWWWQVVWHVEFVMVDWNAFVFAQCRKITFAVLSRQPAVASNDYVEGINEPNRKFCILLCQPHGPATGWSCSIGNVTQC